MAQNITLMGATYSAVPAVELPKQGGGTARFDDTTDANATAADLASGKTAYVNGSKVTGTATGSTDFVVTLSWDSVNEVWKPDCTFAQAQAAYAAGKTIVVVTDSPGSSMVDGQYIDEGGGEEYLVYAVGEVVMDEYIIKFYALDSNGIQDAGDSTYIYPNYETVTKTYTPTESAQTETVTFDSSNYNGLQEVVVTVNGDANLVAGNIKSGTTIFGVTGTYEGGGSSPVKTATGTFTGNGTRTIDVTCDFEPDLVYFTSDPGTTASSGTVAAIIARDMMAATRYRNNSTTNTHYAVTPCVNLNTSGSSYSWRATYASGKVTLYCFSTNARTLLTNGRTYTYKFVKWTT